MSVQQQPKILSRVQTVRRAVLAVLVLMVLVSFSVLGAWPDHHRIHEAVEWAGRGLIAVCIVGRCWCTLYIGGRKGQTLVDVGPYSISRNPLYVFSFLGAAGFGAQTGSLVVSSVVAILVIAIFAVVVGKEETWLKTTHGETFTAYCARTPRFWPRFSAWRDTEVLEVRPKLVAATFRDGLFFLVAIPLAEGFEHLQHIGVLPVLANLP